MRYRRDIVTVVGPRTATGVARGVLLVAVENIATYALDILATGAVINLATGMVINIATCAVINIATGAVIHMAKGAANRVCFGALLGGKRQATEKTTHPKTHVLRTVAYPHVSLCRAFFLL